VSSPRNIKIYVFRSSGPGGQRKNKVATAVRVKHLPTGITATASERRLQSQNRALALQRLEEKLKKLSRTRKPRIPTAVPAASRERRLRNKKITSAKKLLRKESDDDSSF